MKLNCTHLVRSKTRELLEKSNIWEADMLLPVRPCAVRLIFPDATNLWVARAKPASLPGRDCSDHALSLPSDIT